MMACSSVATHETAETNLVTATSPKPSETPLMTVTETADAQARETAFQTTANAEATSTELVLAATRSAQETEKAAQPTLTKSPTKTPQPPPTLTATMSLSDLKGKWVEFVDEKAGITFEYPAVYEHPFYAWCGPFISYGDGETILEYTGKQTWIIQNPKTQTADEVLAELQERDETDDDFTIQSIGQGDVFGYSGYHIEYRFGGTNRYGAASIVEIGDRLVLWDFNAGPWCDIEEIDFSEQEAMIRFGETFRFLDE